MINTLCTPRAKTEPYASSLYVWLIQPILIGYWSKIYAVRLSKSFAYGQINSYNILIVAIRSAQLEKLHSEQLEQLNQL